MQVLSDALRGPLESLPSDAVLFLSQRAETWTEADWTLMGVAFTADSAVHLHGGLGSDLSGVFADFAGSRGAASADRQMDVLLRWFDEVQALRAAGEDHRQAATTDAWREFSTSSRPDPPSWNDLPLEQRELDPAPMPSNLAAQLHDVTVFFVAEPEGFLHVVSSEGYSLGVDLESVGSPFLDTIPIVGSTDEVALYLSPAREDLGVLVGHVVITSDKRHEIDLRVQPMTMVELTEDAFRDRLRTMPGFPG